MNGAQFPRNLLSLWEEEDRMVRWAKKKISERPHLVDQVGLIETYMDAVDGIRQTLPRGDFYYALGGLFLRTFDSSNHALRSAMSGNYSGGVIYARDLLETGFLLNYLLDDPSRPLDWLSASKEKIKSDFSAVRIRIALDKRDGFTEKKRAKHYERLSILGAHPSPYAFELKKDGTRKLNSGPFKQVELLDECIQEIAIATLLLAGLLLDFLPRVPNGSEISSPLSLTLQKVREKYFQSQ